MSAFILTGCATSGLGIATKDDIGKLQWMVNNLRTDMNALEKKVKEMEARLPDKKGEIENRIEGVEDSQKATSKAVSDLFFKAQSFTKDIQQLTGNLEKLRHSYEENKKESIKGDEALRNELNNLKVAVEEINKKVKQLEQSFAPIKKEEGQVKGLEEKTVEKPDMKEVYMTAYEAFKAGKTKEARDMFISFLKDYPDNEYSDNARFWIAESYYKDGNYDDAILAYEELLRKSPESDKIPAAMLKQGMAFYELKDKKTGRLILERLIEKFPDSEQATTAKKKLKES